MRLMEKDCVGDVDCVGDIGDDDDDVGKMVQKM